MGLTIYVCLSETGSYVAQASLKCSMYPDGGLKFLVFQPLPPGIITVCHHAQGLCGAGDQNQGFIHK